MHPNGYCAKPITIENVISFVTKYAQLSIQQTRWQPFLLPVLLHENSRLGASEQLRHFRSQVQVTSRRSVDQKFRSPHSVIRTRGVQANLES